MAKTDVQIISAARYAMLLITGLSGIIVSVNPAVFMREAMNLPAPRGGVS
jgi:hypothetical protein